MSGPVYREICSGLLGESRSIFPEFIFYIKTASYSQGGLIYDVKQCQMYCEWRDKPVATSSDLVDAPLVD